MILTFRTYCFDSSTRSLIYATDTPSRVRVYAYKASLVLGQHTVPVPGRKENSCVHLCLVHAPGTTLSADLPQSSLAAGERPGRITTTQLLKRSLRSHILPTALYSKYCCTCVRAEYVLRTVLRTGMYGVLGCILRGACRISKNDTTDAPRMLPCIVHTPSIPGVSSTFCTPSPESIL